MYQTDCSACIFNSSKEKEKVVCDINRYEIFERRGLVDSESGLINKLCTACRDEKWIKDGENKYCKLHDELSNIYTLLIIDENNDGHVIERLKETLKKPQTIIPKQIIVAYEGEDDLSEISSYIRDYCVEKNIIYSVTKVHEQEYDRHIIDMCIKNVKGMFYLVQVNGIILNENLLRYIYDYIEGMLNSVLVITPNNKSIHGLAVSTLLHKKMSGNLDGFVEDKLEEEMKSIEYPSLLKTWKDLIVEITEDYEYE
jgi:hypothetical protein